MALTWGRRRAEPWLPLPGGWEEAKDSAPGAARPSSLGGPGNTALSWTQEGTALGAATPQQPGPHTCLPLKALGDPGTLAWPPASSGSSLTGSPRHLTQAALPRELRPELHHRSLHAGRSAPLPPTAVAPRVGFGAPCPCQRAAGPLQRPVKIKAWGPPTKQPQGSHRGGLLPWSAHPQGTTKVKVSREDRLTHAWLPALGPMGSAKLTPSPRPTSSHYTELPAELAKWHCVAAEGALTSPQDQMGSAHATALLRPTQVSAPTSYSG